MAFHGLINNFWGHLVSVPETSPLLLSLCPSTVLVRETCPLCITLTRGVRAPKLGFRALQLSQCDIWAHQAETWSHCKTLACETEMAWLYKSNSHPQDWLAEITCQCTRDWDSVWEGPGLENPCLRFVNGTIKQCGLTPQPGPFIANVPQSDQALCQ